MELNYLTLALKKFLNIKKGDSLFISLSKEDVRILNLLIDICVDLKINDVYYEFYEEEPNKQKWGKYIEKDSKFLFIINNSFNNTFAQIIMDAFEREEIDIKYTSMPPLEILLNSNHDTSFLYDKHYIEKFNSEMRKLSIEKSKIQSEKFKRLIVTSYGNVEFEVDFESKIDIPLKDKRLVKYPFHPLEYVFKNDSCTGYVDASDDTYILGNKIKDLRLDIKDGKIIDFDFRITKDTNREKIDNFFKKSKFPYIYSLGLTVPNTDYYSYRQSNNQLIDDVDKPYLLIKNTENARIYLPIFFNHLYVDGVTCDGSIREIYNSDKVFTKKLLK